jgi:hypothetical protein
MNIGFCWQSLLAYRLYDLPKSVAGGAERKWGSPAVCSYMTERVANDQKAPSRGGSVARGDSC